METAAAQIPLQSFLFVSARHLFYWRLRRAVAAQRGADPHVGRADAQRRGAQLRRLRRRTQTPDFFRGMIFAVFVIIVAAAEVGLALGIILRVFRNRATANVDEVDALKW